MPIAACGIDIWACDALFDLDPRGLYKPRPVIDIPLQQFTELCRCVANGFDPGIAIPIAHIGLRSGDMLGPYDEASARSVIDHAGCSQN